MSNYWLDNTDFYTPYLPLMCTPVVVDDIRFKPESVMIATNYLTGWKESPTEAAILLADEWSKQKTNSIDLWGCDFVGQEFFKVFLERCRENTSVLEAVSICWLFPCETGNWGPSLQTVWLNTKKDNICV